MRQAYPFIGPMGGESLYSSRLRVTAQIQSHMESSIARGFPNLYLNESEVYPSSDSNVLTNYKLKMYDTQFPPQDLNWIYFFPCATVVVTLSY